MSTVSHPATARSISRDPNTVRRFLRVLGPGLITGASDDDPSGIGTYAQAGAAFGYATLWTAVATVPMSATVQYVCAKVAMVSGRGLSGVLRQRFPKAVVYPAILALVIANTINAGVDIGAIAAALNLVLPLPTTVFVVPVTLVMCVLLVAGSYRVISRAFRWLTIALLAYVGSAVFAHPQLVDVVKSTLIPTFRADPAFLAMLVAILGTTISPYLFFYQAEDEVETEISLGRSSIEKRAGATPTELKYARWDVTAGIVFSNLVFYFIVLATGATLHQAGETSVDSAAEAARALVPIAGQGAELLLAVGLIGSGLLAVPILVTSASYAVAEVFGWRRGLDQRPRGARRFYAGIVGAMLIGMLVNFAGINPIQALVWTAVLNGVLAPPLLVLILLVANDRRVMGNRTNGRWTNAAGWVTAAVMGLAVVVWLGLALATR